MARRSCSQAYDRVVIRWCLALGVALLAAGQERLAPYATTPEDVVARMLALAGTTKDDLVYDLGSGDGRIPIAAAKIYGARGVGIEIDPKLVDEARKNARAAGVAHLVEFRLEDALDADLSKATVVTLYILASGNAKLRPTLTRQLRPGSRIVSHAFSMGASWPADKVEHFVSAHGDEVTLYLWRVDGKVRE
jgi:protein-L-isoaspartate O-methyltransferase